MKEMNSIMEIESKLKEFERMAMDSCLMIDGETIGHCMQN